MALTIRLDELRFYAYHGVLEQERSVGNHYIVHLEVRLSSVRSVCSDNLYDTIDYSALYALVKQEMDKPSQLLEHVAGRIGRLLFTEFPLIEFVRIELSKCKPPFEADIRSATVILALSRGEI